jgi:hypothetical protein
MAGAAGLRPNHYEVLGISPEASEGDIARAFANKMGMFGARSVTAAAAMGIAFEVLRDTARRRAYDRALGLIGEPVSRQWRMTAPAPSSPGLIGSAWGRLTEESAATTIARPLGATEARPEPATKLEERQVEQLATSTEDERPIDWRRPAIAVGALVLAASLVGTVAGLSVKDAEDAPPAATTTVAVPPAAAHPKLAVPTTVTTVRESPTVRAQRAAAPVRHLVAPPHASLAKKAVDQIQGIAADPADIKTAEATSGTDASAAEPTAAAMTLPKAVIARTIEHIGYSCGTVVSTAPTDGGAGGIYTVTCSSGQTYRATPVHGRYRFHRAEP